MAICKHCDKDMSEVGGCIGLKFGAGNEQAAPIPYDGDKRCHDCNAQPGAFHHPGCDVERCPKCGGQAISCVCFDDSGHGDEDDE